MKVRPARDDLHNPQQKPIFQMTIKFRSFSLLLLVIFSATTFLILPSSPSSSSAHEGKSQSPIINSSAICQAMIDGRDYDLGGGVLCCDRSHHRTDVCYMRGDVRTKPKSSSIFLYDDLSGAGGRGLRPRRPEKIRPYTRKWETSVMNTIDELRLVPVGKLGPVDEHSAGSCDVRHDVPAVVLSTGGYTGNVYHEFNDGLIPLYLTAERFNGEVVFVILEYHSWWFTKYSPVVQRLSRYEIIDFHRDRRVHCFPEMIVGLKIHGELSVERRLMPTGKTIQDFQALLSQSFSSDQPPPRPPPAVRTRPKITIFVRTKSRVLLNLRQLLRRCKRLGFAPQILTPNSKTPLSSIHTALSTSAAMLAVHGAAMTHFLFVPRGAVLIQVVPLGLDWAAEEYYGQPARKMGLEYVEYRVAPRESSLSKEYDRDDPVIADPGVVTGKGWEETKRIYLEHQNVTLDLRRFGKVLARAYARVQKNGRV